MNPLEMIILAASDQAWAAVADRYDDLIRIARGGLIDTQDDTDLVQGVCHLVCGELDRRTG